MRGRARHVARIAHRWLGLVVGVPLALIALSGVAISYWHEIDRATFDYPAPDSRVSTRPLDDQYRIARSACTNCGRLMEITPTQAAAATAFYFERETPGVNTVVVANADGRLLSARNGDRDVVALLYQLHSALFLSRIGQPVVGAIGLALVAMAIVGLSLWWPRRGHWRRSLLPRLLAGPRTRQLYELHRLVGASCSIVLVLVGLSGAAMAFPSVMHRLLGVAEVSAPSGEKKPDTLSLSGLVASATTVVPECHFTDLLLPSPNAPMAVVTLKCPGEWSRYGNTLVWVDPSTGGARLAVDGREHGRRWLLNILVPLHSGYALGAVGQLVFAFVALAPAILLATGGFLFARRRKMQQPAEA